MIESVMFIALGAFASGLVALVGLRALVRRTRRVTEKNLRAALATRRGEFQIERDELKARHAVAIRQLERESGAIRDSATAHRLESDLKDQEKADLRADLNAQEMQVEELTERLQTVQDKRLKSERKVAESGTALRTAHHALESEARRRTDLHDRLAEMTRLSERRRLEIIGLRAEIARLRSRMDFASVSSQPANGTANADPRQSGIAILRPSGATSAPVDPFASALISDDGPVSPIPKPVVDIIDPPEPAEPPVETYAEAPEAENILKIADEIHRIAGEAVADLENNVWRALAHPPAANAQQEQANGGAKAAQSQSGPSQKDNGAGKRKRAKKSGASAKPSNVEPLQPVQDAKAAESRFKQALEDIRALKRTAGPAGE